MKFRAKGLLKLFLSRKMSLKTQSLEANIHQYIGWGLNLPNAAIGIAIQFAHQQTG